MPSRIRIGDMLISAGFVTAEQVEEAVGRQKESGLLLGEELVELGFVTEVQLTQVLSNQLSIPWVSLYHVEFSRELLTLVPAEVADSYCLVPVYVRTVRREGETLFVAMDDPTNDRALDAVRAAAQMPVKPMVAPPSEIRNAIRVYYFAGQTPPSEARRQAQLRQRIAEREDPELTVEVDVEAPPEEAAAPAAPEGAPTEKMEAPPSPAQSGSGAPSKPKPKGRKKPKFITLTLLDGTSVRLPAPGASDEAEEEATASHALTASDLVQALMAKAHGEDVSSVLPDGRWEPLFAALLSLLIRKGLIADWEFVDEWKKKRG